MVMDLPGTLPGHPGPFRQLWNPLLQGKVSALIGIKRHCLAALTEAGVIGVDGRTIRVSSEETLRQSGGAL